MDIHLSKTQRCVTDGISPELVKLIAELLKGRNYGFVKIIIQDGHVFAIEEDRRIHFG